MFDLAGTAECLTHAADEMAGLSLPEATDEQLLELLNELEVAQRRLAAATLGVVAEVSQRGLAAERGMSSTTTMLSRVLRISSSEARGRVAAAEQLTPRQIAGQVLAPPYPQTADAFAAGTIGASQARIITSTLRALPTVVTEERFDELEAQLVGWAEQFTTDQLAQLARHLQEVLDPDGKLRDAGHRERQRDLNVRQRADGSVYGTFEGTAEFGEVLLTLLDKFAAPAPSEGAQHDPRTPGQRRHDGLLDAMLCALRSSAAGDTNGVSTTIVITMTEHQFATGDGLARTGHGASIPVRDALKNIGDTRVFPVAFAAADTGTLATRAIAAYGTSHRIFTEGQRLAMIARDKGCSFPGCTTGAAWTQAHHVTEWKITKRTSVDDGALLCGWHHREFEKLGWRGTMIDGVPHWLAPRWLDPIQTWQRNTAHDVMALV